MSINTIVTEHFHAIETATNLGPHSGFLPTPADLILKLEDEVENLVSVRVASILSVPAQPTVPHTSLESDIDDALDEAYQAGYNNETRKDPGMVARDIVKAHQSHEQKLYQDCVPEKNPGPIGPDVYPLLEVYRTIENEDFRRKLASRIEKALGL